MFLPLSIMLVGASNSHPEVGMIQNIDTRTEQEYHNRIEELKEALTKRVLEIDKIESKKLEIKQSEELESQKLRETLNEKLPEIERMVCENYELYRSFQKIQETVKNIDHYYCKLFLSKEHLKRIESIAKEYANNYEFSKVILYGLRFSQSALKKSLRNEDSSIGYFDLEEQEIMESDLGELKARLSIYNHAIGALPNYNKYGLELLNELIDIFEKTFKCESSCFSCIWELFYQNELVELEKIRKSINGEASEIPEEPATPGAGAAATPEAGAATPEAASDIPEEPATPEAGAATPGAGAAATPGAGAAATPEAGAGAPEAEEPAATAETPAATPEAGAGAPAAEEPAATAETPAAAPEAAEKKAAAEEPAASAETPEAAATPEAPTAEEPAATPEAAATPAEEETLGIMSV